MSKPFSHNPAHAVGTCSDCGEEMTYNVPRLGIDGGFVHKNTGNIECMSTQPEPSATPFNQIPTPVSDKASGFAYNFPHNCPLVPLSVCQKQERELQQANAELARLKAGTGEAERLAQTLEREAGFAIKEGLRIVGRTLTDSAQLLRTQQAENAILKEKLSDEIASLFRAKNTIIGYDMVIDEQNATIRRLDLEASDLHTVNATLRETVKEARAALVDTEHTLEKAADFAPNGTGGWQYIHRSLRKLRAHIAALAQLSGPDDSAARKAGA